MRSFFTITGVLVILQSCSLLTAKDHSSHSGGHDLQPGRVTGPTGPSKIFPFKKYEDFQISDGIAGNSSERANEVFVKPFDGINFAEITQIDLNNLAAMANTAIVNEKFFVEAIKKSGTTKKHSNKPLDAGLTANKVLKLVGAIQVLEVHKKLNIKLGEGDDSLKEFKQKLAKNIELDKKRAGQKMVSYLSVGKKSGGSKSASGNSGTGSNPEGAGKGGKGKKNGENGSTNEGNGSNTGKKGENKSTSADDDSDDD